MTDRERVDEGADEIPKQQVLMTGFDKLNSHCNTR